MIRYKTSSIYSNSTAAFRLIRKRECNSACIS